MFPLRQFLQESDFHGLRFFASGNVSLARRMLWLVMILSSLTVMGYMIVLRVGHYYTYPTSTDITVDSDVIPVPAIGLCTKALTRLRPNRLTDIDILYTLFHQGFQVFLNQYKLNEEILEFTRNLSRFRDDSASIKYAVSRYGALAGLYDKHGDTDSLYILSRLAEVSLDLGIDVRSQYPQFLLRNGLTRANVQMCETKVSTNSAVMNCTEYMKQILTISGTCLVLDSINGSAIVFQDNQVVGHRNYIYILLDQNIEAKLFDRNDILGHYYGSEQYSYSRSSMVVVNKVTETVLLGVPYSKKPCSKMARSYCMRECLATEQECVPYYHSDVESTKNKRVCTPDPTKLPVRWPPEVRKCGQLCVPSCHTTEFAVELHEGSGSRLLLEVNKYAKHELSVQVSLNSMGSLLAELGGTMGLFIGASVLTLYHCIEYSGMKLFTLTARTGSKNARHFV